MQVENFSSYTVTVKRATGNNDQNEVTSLVLVHFISIKCGPII